MCGNAGNPELFSPNTGLTISTMRRGGPRDDPPLVNDARWNYYCLGRGALDVLMWDVSTHAADSNGRCSATIASCAMRLRLKGIAKEI